VSGRGSRPRRRKGALLGNRTNIVEARRKAADSNRKIAAAFTANVSPVIEQIRAAGVTGYKAIAAALNARGVRSARSGLGRYRGAEYPAQERLMLSATERPRADWCNWFNEVNDRSFVFNRMIRGEKVCVDTFLLDLAPLFQADRAGSW
jgi:hypothetical protein